MRKSIIFFGVAISIFILSFSAMGNVIENEIEDNNSIAPNGGERPTLNFFKITDWGERFQEDETINFVACGSDADSDRIKFVISWGDGSDLFEEWRSVENGVNCVDPDHIYSSKGSYYTTCYVEDPSGLKSNSQGINIRIYRKGKTVKSLHFNMLNRFPLLELLFKLIYL